MQALEEEARADAATKRRQQEENKKENGGRRNGPYPASATFKPQKLNHYERSKPKLPREK